MKLLHRVILPEGFQASALASGIKKSGKFDLALFYSKVAAKAACLFTANKIQAAPVLLSKEHLKRAKSFRAVVANSGNANCFTSKAGLYDARQTTRRIAKILGVKEEEVLVCSTGIIGKRLPLSKIQDSLPSLAAGLSAGGIANAKQAILTTDTCPKEAMVQLNIGSKMVTISGVAKGSGMIAPILPRCWFFFLPMPALARER